MPRPRTAGNKGLRKERPVSFEDEDLDEDVKYDKVDKLMKGRADARNVAIKKLSTGGKKFGFELGSDEELSPDDDEFDEYSKPVMGVNVSDEDEDEDLELDDDEELDDSEDDDDDDDEEDDEEDDEDDDDDDDDDDDPYYKTLKSIKGKLTKKATSDSEEDDDDDDEKDADKSWGKNKAAYYGEDRERDDYDVDDEEKEEDEMQEEEEVRKLQKAKASLLKSTDFQDETLQELLANAEKEKQKDIKGGMSKADAALLENFNRDLDDIELVGAVTNVEKISKNLSSLSKDEKLQVVLSESPELIEFLADYKDIIQLIRSKYQPSVEWLEKSNLMNTPPARFYKTKLGILMSYCSAISYYLLLKSTAQQSKDHPIIAHLIRLRGIMDTLKTHEEGMDTAFKDLNQKAAQETKPAEAAKSLDTKKASTKKNQETNERQEKIQSKPEEKKPKSKKQTDKLAVDDEADFFMNLAEQKSNKESKSKSKSKLIDYADFVDPSLDPTDKLVKQNPIHQYINMAAQNEKSKKEASQDADVPVREMTFKKPTVQAAMPMDESDDEDVFDTLAASEKSSKKTKTKEPKPDLNSPVAEGEKRLATRQIVVNRGLVRPRNKKNKNSRVKFRNKYSKAVTKGHSTTKSYKGQSAFYGGERTGIRANVSHSVKMKS
eukprot:TRINITY_DN3313_c0_g2_i1.p1 TRINITY_DN3313_c0_g2~~TRINITY_DN3313_c0_g2_i1.p1  ORF type:complete len:661 (+),score=226.04 TRINITY_DN3313_c0_g2_i1:72-2054(+)